MTNYFSTESVAERYAHARPAFHHHVVDRLKVFFADSLPFARALDVGCGTGGSTFPIERLATRFIGVDPSLPMLRRGDAGSTAAFIAGLAENLPFQDTAFDLVTVSSAFHWFNRSSFLAEARRVLQKAGKLVVYDNYFSGKTIETDELYSWVFESYRLRYPTPPRATVSFLRDSLEDGFRCIHEEDYGNTISFRLETLIEYLTTQTNVIAAIEEGRDSLDGVKRHLRRELKPFFTKPTITVCFGGPIWILESVV